MLTLYGIHPVLEALKKRPKVFHRLFLAHEKGSEDYRRIISIANAARIPTASLPAKELSRLCRSEQHQGVVAEVEPVPLFALEELIAHWKKQDEKALFLILDSIQDPQNFGSLIRTAYCCGATGIIFPKDRAASITGAVAKASSGAAEHIPLCRVVNIAATIELLKKEGVWIVGTTPETKTNLYEFDFNLDVAVIIGAEGTGMRHLVTSKCDFCISIPMKGELDSLNASVAGAVVLFEIMRQRQPVIKKHTGKK
jgi:23S rRNA (guanosine2251-2'-O)-methyltransferase